MNKHLFFLVTLITCLGTVPAYAQFSPTENLINLDSDTSASTSTPDNQPATGAVINADGSPLESQSPQTNTAAPEELTEANITKFLIDIAALAIRYVLVIAAIFIMLAGYIYITSFGNKQRIEQAKQMLLYTITGILVVLGAYLAVNTILSQITQTATIP